MGNLTELKKGRLVIPFSTVVIWMFLVAVSLCDFHMVVFEFVHLENTVGSSKKRF